MSITLVTWLVPRLSSCSVKLVKKKNNGIIQVAIKKKKRELQTGLISDLVTFTELNKRKNKTIEDACVLSQRENKLSLSGYQFLSNAESSGFGLIKLNDTKLRFGVWMKRKEKVCNLVCSIDSQKDVFRW